MANSRLLLRILKLAFLALLFQLSTLNSLSQTPYYFDEGCVIPSGEIHLGTGQVHVWNASLDVRIPQNRKSWAISMAYMHALFTNYVGRDVMSINEYFATALQESNCGCDQAVTEYNTLNPWETLCNDNAPPAAVAAGFFQLERTTGYTTVRNTYPGLFPSGVTGFRNVVVGDKFETSGIAKVYYDFISMKKIRKDCGFMNDFVTNGNDPYALTKYIAALYNRGHNWQILIDNRSGARRAGSQADSQILHWFHPTPPLTAPGCVTNVNDGAKYAEQISRITQTLDNNLGDIDPYLSTCPGVSPPAPILNSHNFNSFYNAQISWSDFDYYLDRLKPLFAPTGVDIDLIKPRVKAVFDGINSGNSISFQFDAGKVIDEILVSLPMYGGYMNGCGVSANITGWAPDSICVGDVSTIDVKLNGTPPFELEWTDGEIFYVKSGIMSNTTTIDVTKPGKYYITYVKDANSESNLQCVITKAAIIYTKKGCTCIPPIVTVNTPPDQCDDAYNLVSAFSTDKGILNYYIDAAATMPATNPVTSSGTYYAQADDFGCKSNIESVVITINTSPTLTTTDPATQCGGTVDLAATANTNTGTITYYSDATANTSISNIVSTGAVYYAQSEFNGCKSSIEPIKVVINADPPTPNEDPFEVCAGGDVDLTLTSTSPGNVDWYEANTGGASIKSGLTYNYSPGTLPKTFYVEIATVIPATTGASSLPNGSAHGSTDELFFETFTSVTFISFDARYAWGNSSVTWQILDVNNGNAVMATGSQTLSMGGASTINVNTLLPPSKYAIKFSSSILSWSPTKGTDIPGVISIQTNTGWSNAGGTIAEGYPVANIRIETSEVCPRVPVNVIEDIVCCPVFDSVTIVETSLTTCSSGGSETLTATLVGNLNPISSYDFRWMNGTTEVQTWTNGVAGTVLSNASILTGGNGTYTVEIRATAFPTCVKTSSGVLVTITSSIIPSITLSQGVACEGGNVVVRAAVSGGGNSPVITWSTTASTNNSDSDTLLITNVVNGVSVDVALTSSSTCASPTTDSDQLTLSANAVVTATIATECDDVNSGLAVDEFQIRVKVLTGDLGSIAITELSTIGGITWSKVGTDEWLSSAIDEVNSVDINITDQNDCGGGYDNPSPITRKCSCPSGAVIMISNTNPVCKGTVLDLDIIISPGTSAGPFDITVTGPNSYSDTKNNVLIDYTLNVADTGSYQISVFNDQAANCQGGIGTSVALKNHPEPSASLSLVGSDARVCENGLVIREIEINMGVGSPIFTIDYTDGTNAQTITTSDNPYMLSVSSKGVYALTGLEDGNGCLGVISGADIAITEEVIPSLTLNESQKIICERESIELIATTTGDLKWYQVPLESPPSTPLGPVLTTNTNYIASSSGIYIITSEVGGMPKCYVEDSVTVEVIDVKIKAASFSPNPVAIRNNITLNATVEPIDNYSYGWTIANGGNASASGNPAVYTTSIEGKHQVNLVVENSIGCTDSKNLGEVIVFAPVLVPNVFTPNGDEVGDVWRIDGMRSFESTIRIYNRWGNLVFESFKYENPWNGTYNGKPSPSGTYYYIIEITDPLYDGEERTLQGQIQVLR